MWKRKRVVHIYYGTQLLTMVKEIKFTSRGKLKANKQTFRLMKLPRQREINIACSILFEGPSFKYFVLHVYLRYMWKSEN